MYYFQPEVDCQVTVATCNSAQFVDDFDTVLYVLGNATGPGLMEVVACNDDACSYLSQLTVSLLKPHGSDVQCWNHLTFRMTVWITHENTFGSISQSLMHHLSDGELA